LEFHSLREGTPDVVAGAWVDRVVAATSKLAASELYAGPGWQQSLAAFRFARQIGDFRLFIMSAGLGLVEADERIPAYTATFAFDIDQVSRRITTTSNPVLAHQSWWEAVNRAQGRGVMPIADRACESAVCLVGAGSGYLSAVARDIEAAAHAVGPERLYIVCAGAPRRVLPEVVKACLLPIGAEIESLIPGARTSLNARAVGWLLRDVVPVTGWNRTAIVRAIEKELARASAQPAESPTIRRRLSDEEIRNWIASQWATDPEASRSVLLRGLRQIGLSCEQRRFRGLVARARAERELGK